MDEWWNGDETVRECWTFLIYIFLHQQRKQCLELRFQNWEKLANIWLVLAIQTVMPVGYTILLLSAKQSRENQRNGASRFKKNVSEKLSIIYPLWNEEKSLANWIRYICRQKTTTSLRNLDRKGNWITRKSVTTNL